MIVAITSLDLIWNFNSFALVFVLTAGGPGGQTMLPMLFAYNEAFRYGNFGYAAALGNVMVIVIAAFLFFYLRGQARSRDHDADPRPASTPRPVARKVPSHRAPRATSRPLQYLALAGYVRVPRLPAAVPAVDVAQDAAGTAVRRTRRCSPESLNWATSATPSQKANLVQAAGNSLYVAALTTVIVTVISLPAAYALARFRTKLRGVATGWILLSQVFPFILIVIPVFLVLKQVGLVNNPLGLVLVYTVWCLPFALWMLRGYVAAIPVDLEEAGAIDGAARLRVLRSIVLPLLAPGLVATSLFTFISSWNEFFFALVLIQDPGLQTLPLTLARFVGAEGQVQLGQLAAASLLATIPSLVFFLIIQRRLTSGLMSGAVKG